MRCGPSLMAAFGLPHCILWMTLGGWHGMVRNSEGNQVKPARSAIANVFWIAATLLVASILFTYFVGLAAIDRNRKVATQRSILQHLEHFISTVRDAETAQQGYLLTGDEHSLGPYNRAVARVH